MAVDTNNDIKAADPRIGRFSQGMPLSYPKREGGIFKNPWSTWEDHGITALMSFFKSFASEMSETGEPHKDPVSHAKCYLFCERR